MSKYQIIYSKNGNPGDPNYRFSNLRPFLGATNEELTSIEIHGFCDASEDAYAAVVYLKSFYKSGKTHVALVMAKSKVAQIRRQSIPRLELCGAVLLARLLNHLSSVLYIPVSKAWAWTDSTIVLDWLSGSPRRFKTFVGNRVSEILDITSPSQWRHVPTASNSADCASRGMSPSELSQHHLWWQGPSWLRWNGQLGERSLQKKYQKSCESP